MNVNKALSSSFSWFIAILSMVIIIGYFAVMMIQKFHVTELDALEYRKFNPVPKDAIAQFKRECSVVGKDRNEETGLWSPCLAISSDGTVYSITLLHQDHVRFNQVVDYFDKLVSEEEDLGLNGLTLIFSDNPRRRDILEAFVMMKKVTQ